MEPVVEPAGKIVQIFAEEQIAVRVIALQDVLQDVDLVVTQLLIARVIVLLMPVKVDVKHLLVMDSVVILARRFVQQVVLQRVVLDVKKIVKKVAQKAAKKVVI